MSVRKLQANSYTVGHCTQQGHRAQIVETRRGPFSFDLWGADVICMCKDGTTLLIQCTDVTNVSKRRKKLKEPETAEAIRDWLSRPGHRYELWGWRPVKPVPPKKVVTEWTLHVCEEVNPDAD